MEKLAGADSAEDLARIVCAEVLRNRDERIDALLREQAVLRAEMERLQIERDVAELQRKSAERRYGQLLERVVSSALPGLGAGFEPPPAPAAGEPEGLDHRVLSLQERLDDAGRELTIAKAQLSAVVNSRSWKLSAPLRRLLAALTGRP